jgi:hypothetical protein
VTDFRIVLPEDPLGISQRELDWDREDAFWTLSERELGSSRWDPAGAPSPWELGEVLRFFQLREQFEESVLRQMGPGECLLAHASQQSGRNVIGDLCDTCGNHWIVYRRESEGAEWRRYGRTCDFSWYRGNVADASSDSVLARLTAEVVSE